MKSFVTRAFPMFATAVFLSFLSGGCSSVAKSVGGAMAENMNEKTVGRPYTEVIQDPRTYGPLIGEEKLPANHVVKKHFTDRQGKGSAAESAGPGGEGMNFQGKLRMATYFKVDSKGIVRDWAFGYVDVGTGFGLGGISFTELLGVKDREVFIDEVDKTVRTRDDQPYTVWKQ